MPQSFAEALSWVPKSRNLAVTLARAADYAKAQSHRAVILEHLLLALVSDSDAAAVLQACQVDLARLNADLTNFLAGIQDRQAGSSIGEPAAAPDLLRILEYASAAAQQSRRREINGAIVLAAIVGDGRSAAAGMLRAQGLTFEETIKALQRANAAGARPSGAPPAQAVPTDQPSSPAPPATRSSSQAVNGANGQTTEEILAAARRRVDAGRSGSIPGAPAAAASPGRSDPVPQAAIPDTQPRDRSGGDAGIEPQSFDDLKPHEQGRPSGQPPPQPLRAPPPFAPRTPLSEQDDPQWHRPAPPLAREAGQPQAPLGQPPVPRPEQARGTPQPQSVAYDLEPPRGRQEAAAAAEGGGEASPRLAEARRRRSRRESRGGSVSSGQLVENIPRSMTVGRRETVEVRIAKADVNALAGGLQGAGTAYRHDLIVTKAMAVRLRAPDGGFWIETTTPETQWIENTLGPLSDEFASWRWTITPKRRGKARLHLVVSARTVGTDGLAAETALPDRVITVKVRVNLGQTAALVGGWIAAAVVGGMLAKFGEGAWELGRSLLDRLGGA
jgi:hypothetical protein